MLGLRRLGLRVGGIIEVVLEMGGGDGGRYILTLVLIFWRFEKVG